MPCPSFAIFVAGPPVCFVTWGRYRHFQSRLGGGPFARSGAHRRKIFMENGRRYCLEHYSFRADRAVLFHSCVDFSGAGVSQQTSARPNGHMVAMIYTIGLFAAVAVVAVILFVVVAILRGAVNSPSSGAERRLDGLRRLDRITSGPAIGGKPGR